MKTNTDKDMKPTAYGSKYPKFLLEEISSSLCQTPLKPRKFKVRTEVEVGSPIFWREIFSQLESSLPRPKSFQDARKNPKKIQAHFYSSGLFFQPHDPILVALKGQKLRLSLPKIICSHLEQRASSYLFEVILAFGNMSNAKSSMYNLCTSKQLMYII